MNDSRVHRWDRIIFVLTAAPVAAVVLFFAFVHYQWRDTTPRGVLSNFNDWPEPVQELKLNLTDRSSPDPSFQVYLLYGKPAQTLSTVICRMDYSVETFQTIESFLKLSPVQENEAVQVHRQVEATGANDWWPTTNSKAEYFVCEGLVKGDEGPLFWVAVDRSCGRIFVYYYFDF